MTERSHILKTFGPKEIFCRQGTPADSLYILRKGRVGIYINSNADSLSDADILDKGIEVAVISTPNSIIGEGGIFLKHRTASMVALSYSTIIEEIPIASGDLFNIMKERPQLSMTLCRSLASRLVEVTEKVRSIAFLADGVEKAYDNFSIDYVHIINQARNLASENADFLRVVEELEDSHLYHHGKALEQHRKTTCMILNRESRQQRTGIMNLKSGDVLCEAGNMGRAFYLVRSGKLEVKVGNILVNTIGPDEIVGEIAVILKEAPKRTATVRAIADSMIHCIPAVKFYELAEEQPEFLIPIARSMAARLDTTNRLICNRSRESKHNITSLAGDPLSCEAQFSMIARKLSSFDDASEIVKSAQKEAVKASRLQESLFDSGLATNKL
ncbi:MAG: cyclic nucleotide-binding domain-containing protein [Planctomycetes bacterium]|nr:cyclic nucleotide-binding domain-containing protein [Planctomycetota bacterium]